eukprot:247070-Pyramimonas_sp.AAC.1
MEQSANSAPAIRAPAGPLSPSIRTPDPGGPLSRWPLQGGRSKRQGAPRAQCLSLEALHLL